MPTTDELYQLAIRAIDDLYRDRSVPLPELRERLQSIHGTIDQRVAELDAADWEGGDADVPK